MGLKTGATTAVQGQRNLMRLRTGNETKRHQLKRIMQGTN